MEMVNNSFSTLGLISETDAIAVSNQASFFVLDLTGS
jgi:hypothetical protein